MSRVTGLGWTTFTVEDSGGTARDLRRDTTALQVATPRAVQEVTGLDELAMARLALLADGSITINATADFAAGASIHTVFSDVTSDDTEREVINTTNGKTLTMTMLFTDYPINRGNTGELNTTIPGVLSNGVPPAWS